MQTILPDTCIFFLFVLAFTAGNANSDEICEDPTGETYERAHCDFEQDWCQWRNTLGNEIKWEGQTTLDKLTKTHYVRAPMSDASPGSVARLASPWFRATGSQQCTLQFQYFGPNDNCQLSVFLVNHTSSTELVWQPRGSKVSLRFREIEPIRLPHSNCRHRIMFEARKLADGGCDYFGVPAMSNNAVDIDNIEFRCFSPLTPTRTTARGRTVTTPSSLNSRIFSIAVTATSTSSSTSPSSDLSSSSESLSAGGSRADGAMAKRKLRSIHLIAGIVFAAVVVVFVVLVIVVCRNSSRGGAICGMNIKSQNASSSGAPAQSEGNGTVNRMNTDLTHSNPAFVSDDGVTSACYLARDQDSLYSVPNKPRHGKKATSNGHPKGDNQVANPGQDDYNHLSVNKSRAGPSSSPKQRRAAQPYDHLARGDEHHGDVTEPTPGDRRTGCGTRTLMADVLQSDEYNTLSITTLRASASSAAAPPSSARTYDHLPCQSTQWASPAVPFVKMP